MKPHRPRVVLFDAVGTLIHPRPSAGSVYHEIGARFGSRITRAQISELFPQSLQRVFLDEHRHLPTNEELEWQRWRQVVMTVFADVDVDEGLFEALWNHFANAANWSLFPDVAATWQELAARGFVFGIASNFDHRLIEICRQLPPLDQCQHLFISTQLGFSKPDRRYFRLVESHFALQATDILLVGDSWHNDVEAGRSSGWQVCWINRQEESLTRNMDRVANKEECEINSLGQLLERFN